MMIDYGLRTFVSLKFAHIYGIYGNRLLYPGFAVVLIRNKLSTHYHAIFSIDGMS